jgi:hypothetical protein
VTPPPFDLAPKKITDQRLLTPSCTQNKAKATFALLVVSPVLQTRKTEIAISKYRVVHTGPNTRLGGVYGGFYSPAYHVGIALKVKRLPIPPAAKQAIMLTKSLINSFQSKALP